MRNGNDKCENCGGDRAIHHYQTDQCPVGGIEAPVGRPQEWKESSFSAARASNQRYPVNGNHVIAGLTKREYFAARAYQGLLANGVPIGQNPLDRGAALEAVRAADALIDALNYDPNGETTEDKIRADIDAANYEKAIAEL